VKAAFHSASKYFYFLEMAAAIERKNKRSRWGGEDALSSSGTSFTPGTPSGYPGQSPMSLPPGMNSPFGGSAQGYNPNMKPPVVGSPFGMSQPGMSPQFGASNPGMMSSSIGPPGVMMNPSIGPPGLVMNPSIGPPGLALNPQLAKGEYCLDYCKDVLQNLRINKHSRVLF